MRTTLTIDDDIAAVLERLRRTRDASLKDLVNEALRRGLKDMDARPKRGAPFRMQSVAQTLPSTKTLLRYAKATGSRFHVRLSAA